jgi:O-antigen/teichoic acid export membrane protein
MLVVALGGFIFQILTNNCYFTNFGIAGLFFFNAISNYFESFKKKNPLYKSYLRVSGASSFLIWIVFAAMYSLWAHPPWYFFAIYLPVIFMALILHIGWYSVIKASYQYDYNLKVIEYMLTPERKYYQENEEVKNHGRRR